MKHNLNFLKGIKNASYLAAANLASEIVQLFAMIYIVRELGVENYGIWVTIGAFTGFFGFFTFSGLNKVIIREGSKNISNMSNVLEEVIGLRNLCHLFAVFVCLISANFAPYDDQIKLYILLFSCTLIIDGSKSLLGTVYTATENFKILSILTIADKFFYVSAALLSLYLGYGLYGLLLGSIVTNFLMLILRYKISKNFVKFNILSKLVIRKDYVKQGFTFSLIGFVGTLGTRVDLLMLSIMGTVKEVAIYAIANKLVRQGNMLRNVCSEAFFPMTVRRIKEGSVSSSYLVSMSISIFVVVTFLAYLAGFFVTPFIIFTFGDEYSSSGHILQILLLYQGFGWAYLPFTLAMQASHNEYIALYINPFKAILNIPLNVIFYYNFGIVGIAYSTLCVYSLGNLFGSILIYNKLKKDGKFLD